MSRIIVVLVSPQSEGNIGAIARAMMNFGLEEMFIVTPECEIGLEARRRAMHADGILDNARVLESLDDALAETDLVVGTSGVKTVNEKKFGRMTVTPREFAEKMKSYEGSVALLFGQEDFGLSRENIMRCDLLVTIPASDRYPIMNVSQAAAVILYELFVIEAHLWRPRAAGEMELNRIIEQFMRLLERIDYPEHKRKKTAVMFRRILGRATLTKWEYHTMMGVLKDAAKR